ncbi:MAG: aminotransferase class I/II-fold pyridoxal phosphate-dependent enzyme [Hyphomicrobiales bacterium]|nr:aminotransferase class I/II-fold pyridoxal phosphate-dependent enzyme [Hyphomicrobiales bacterium]
MSDNEAPSTETLIAQALHFIDEASGAVVPAWQPSTTFARREDAAHYGDYSYSRSGSPTVHHLEQMLARLEGGADARIFSSGLAAITCLMETLPTGAHVVAPRVMYHGAQDWLHRLKEKRGLKVTFFNQSDPAGLAGAIRSGETRIAWAESPANPTWDVIDIAAAAKTAHAAGALLAVDATCAPPVLCQPLKLGADLVFHSATKYLNGHSDVTAGVLITNEASTVWSEIDHLRTYMGSILPPFECWLLIRGMRTVFLRVERASINALAIARHFENHRGLESVLYPGLASHPGHEIAARQMPGGFGGMLSLLVDGSVDDTAAVMSRLKVFVRATSLGGVESLAEHRYLVEGANSVVPKNLIRLSVGIEAVDDLIADLEQALAG